MRPDETVRINWSGSLQESLGISPARLHKGLTWISLGSRRWGGSWLEISFCLTLASLVVRFSWNWWEFCLFSSWLSFNSWKNDKILTMSKGFFMFFWSGTSGGRSQTCPPRLKGKGLGPMAEILRLSKPFQIHGWKSGSLFRVQVTQTIKILLHIYIYIYSIICIYGICLVHSAWFGTNHGLVVWINICRVVWTM